jgi:hypothetical protein
LPGEICAAAEIVLRFLEPDDQVIESEVERLAEDLFFDGAGHDCTSNAATVAEWPQPQHLIGVGLSHS